MKKTTKLEMVEVEFLVDQSGQFGEKEKGDCIPLDAVSAANLKSRGIVKFKKGDDNGK